MLVIGRTRVIKIISRCHLSHLHQIMSHEARVTLFPSMRPQSWQSLVNGYDPSSSHLGGKQVTITIESDNPLYSQSPTRPGASDVRQKDSPHCFSK